ncbi:hypothetical protein RCL1_004303 [Eukaryota sp. TZLM3-RCL]
MTTSETLLHTIFHQVLGDLSVKYDVNDFVSSASITLSNVHYSKIVAVVTYNDFVHRTETLSVSPNTPITFSFNISFSPFHNYLNLILLDSSSFVNNGYPIIGTYQFDLSSVFQKGSSTFPAQSLVPSPMNPPTSYELTEQVALSVTCKPIETDLPSFSELNQASITAERNLKTALTSFFQNYRALCPSYRTRFHDSMVTSEFSNCLLLNRFFPKISFNNHVLPTPQHCARFVSLIPTRPFDVDCPGQSKCRMILTPSTVLSVGYGDVIDKCILLCNLLLNFHLRAFVAVGQSNSGFLAYVLTFETSSDQNPIVWDVISGRRTTPKKMTSSFTVDLLFNHSKILLNIQQNNSISETIFAFLNPQLWLSFNSETIKNYLSAFPNQNSINLRQKFSPLEVSNIEISITNLVCSALKDYRLISNRSTLFINDYDNVLKQALFAYEHERIFGVSVGNDLFSQSIQNLVPTNQSFKAVPVPLKYFQCDENSGNLVLSLVNSSSAGKQLIELTQETRFSVVVSFFPYLENFGSIWVIIGAIFDG